VPNLLHDLRQGICAAPADIGFTLAAVLTLALAIAANTTTFSAVHAVRLEQPPYPAPQELALVTPVSHHADQAPDQPEPRLSGLRHGHRPQ